MMFGMLHEGKKVNKTLEISLKEERDLVIREIQAFAGDYDANAVHTQ